MKYNSRLGNVATEFNLKSDNSIVKAYHCFFLVISNLEMNNFKSIIQSECEASTKRIKIIILIKY